MKVINTRRNRAALLLIAALIGCLLACGRNNETLEVRVQEAVKSELAGRYLASGRVHSRRVEVAPEVSGKILDIPVEEAQEVRKGDILVVIEDQDQEARVANLRASLRASQSLVDESARRLNAQRAVARNSSARAQAEHSKATWQLRELERGTDRRDLMILESALDVAKINLEQARKDRERMDQLFLDEVVSKVELEQSVTKEKLALAQRNQALQELEKAKAGASMEQLQSQRANVQLAQASLSSAANGQAETLVLEQQLQTRTLEMERLQSDLKQVEERWSRSTLRAPADGIVARRLRNPGEIAHYGAPLVTLMVPGELWVSANVAEQDATFVALEQSVKVTLPSLPGQEFEGRVARIAPSFETPPNSPGTARFLNVEIRFSKDSLDIKPGLEADVAGSQILASEALVIPRRAIFSKNDRNYAMVVENGKIRALELELGTQNTDEAEVKSGLSPGQSVIVEGADLRDEGRPAEIKSPS